MNRRWLKILLAIVVVACFLYAGRGYYDQLYRIRDAHWLGILGIALVHMLMLWTQGLTLKLGLDVYDDSINEREGFALSILSAYTNLLLPRSGVGTVAVYLKRVRNTPLMDYSSVVLYNAGLFVFASSLVTGIVFGIDWLVLNHRPPTFLLVGLPILILGSGVAVTVHWKVPKNYQGIGTRFLNRLSSATLTLTHSGNVWRIGLLHFAMVLLRALRLQIAFWAMGVEVGFVGVLMASVLGDLAFVVAVTPAALGFREAAVTFVAAKMGTTTAVALSVAIFDRLVFSLTVVLLAQLTIALLARRRNQAAAPSKLLN